MTGPMVYMALTVVQVSPESMPAVDQDVLIWPAAGVAAQLGAYLGEGDLGSVWVGTNGEDISAPVAWAEMPVLPRRW